MYKVRDFYRVIDKFAPFRHTEGQDNVGLLIGDENAGVKMALIALDATANVIDEAVSIGANLIITHHPIIFNPLINLLSDSKAYKLAAAGVSVICAHTNLDMARGGVNDALADALELEGTKGICAVQGDTELFIARAGEVLHPMHPEGFARYVKEKLHLPGLYYVGGKRDVKTVALCSGDGTGYFEEAVKIGADAYVTGESKHHILLKAGEKGITYIAAGHFGTENVIVAPLANILKKSLPNVDILISRTCTDGIRFI